MKPHLCTIKKLIVSATVLHLLAACASTHHSATDVSMPSDREFTEFDAVVDVPLPSAYQNILNKAPTYWCSPFSGQIVAYTDPAIPGHEISFVVPGKFLGSKVELATVRLYPQDGGRTRLVGTSFVYPGTWNMAELDNWANAVPGSCATINEISDQAPLLVAG